MKLERTVSQMVFCDLISSDGTKFIYGIGGSPDDITGILTVDCSDGSFEITKEPEKTKVYIRHIASMLRRAHNRFVNGMPPKKMAYQI